MLRSLLGQTQRSISVSSAMSDSYFAPANPQSCIHGCQMVRQGCRKTDAQQHAWPGTSKQLALRRPFEKKGPVSSTFTVARQRKGNCPRSSRLACMMPRANRPCEDILLGFNAFPTPHSSP